MQCRMYLVLFKCLIVIDKIPNLQLGCKGTTKKSNMQINGLKINFCRLLVYGC